MTPRVVARVDPGEGPLTSRVNVSDYPGPRPSRTNRGRRTTTTGGGTKREKKHKERVFSGPRTAPAGNNLAARRALLGHGLAARERPEVPRLEGDEGPREGPEERLREGREEAQGRV